MGFWELRYDIAFRVGRPDEIARLIFAGDGGSGLRAQLGTPSGLSSDGAGGVYIANRGSNTVRRLFANGTIVGVAGVAFSAASTGDGGPATSARFKSIAGAAADSGVGEGGLWLCDTANHAVRYMWPNRTVTRVAGNTTAAYAGDGGPAILALMNSPYHALATGTGGGACVSGGVLQVANEGTCYSCSLTRVSPRDSHA